MIEVDEKLIDRYLGDIAVCTTVDEFFKHISEIGTSVIRRKVVLNCSFWH